MNKKSAILFATFVFLICCNPIFANEFVDAVGAKVIVPDHPSRIVTLAPSLGELIADFLGEHLERMIGVSEYTDEPPALKKVTSIGPYGRVNLEKIVALKPDLVFATTDGNSKDQIEHLREMKIPVLTVVTENLNQVSDSMRLVGKALGMENRGEEMAAQFNRGLENIHEKCHGRKSRRVMIELSETPLIVVGGKTFLQGTLEALGATNIYSDSKNHYPRPSIEDVVSRNPDVIIILALGSDAKSFYQMKKRWLDFPKLKATQEGTVRVIPGDSIARPTLRLLEGLSLLEKAIYGSS